MGAGESRFAVSEALLLLEDKQDAATESQFEPFLSSDLSASEFSELISLSSVRSIFTSNQKNACLLLEVCVARIEALVSAYHKDAPPPDKTREVAAMNAVRIVTRMMPVLYECATTDATLSAFAAGPFPARVVSALMATLFLPGFTCGIMADPGKPDSLTGVVGACLWYGGLVSTAPKATPAAVGRRVDIMRCLLTVLSSDLYSPKSAPRPPAAAMDFFHSPACPNTFLLLLSTLNMLDNFIPTATVIGAIGGKTAAMATQVRVAISLLSVALSSDDSGDDSSTKSVIAFHLQSISSPESLSLVFGAISRLIAAPVNTPLLRRGAVDLAPDLTLFLTVLLQHCPALGGFVASCGAVGDMIRGVVHMMLQAAEAYDEQPSAVGTVYLGLKLLTGLSTRRNFCVALNQPLSAKSSVAGTTFPAKASTLQDIVIAASAHVGLVFRDASPTIRWHALVLTANVSPYLQRLSPAATPLLDRLLLDAFIPDPRSGQYPCALTECALDVVNSILHHQFSGNGALVLALVRRYPTIKPLLDLCRRCRDRPRVGSDGVPPYTAWLVRLPVQSLAVMFRVLRPHVAEAERTGMADGRLIGVISVSTLVGLLPSTPMRQVRDGDGAGVATWLRAHAWGLVLHRWDEYPLFDLKAIKIFGG